MYDVINRRWRGETLRESIKRHEHFLALHLHLKPGMKVAFCCCVVNAVDSAGNRREQVVSWLSACGGVGTPVSGIVCGTVGFCEAVQF